MNLSEITFDAINNLGGMTQLYVADATTINSVFRSSNGVLSNNITFTGANSWQQIKATLYTTNVNSPISNNTDGVLASPSISGILPTDNPDMIAQLRALSGKKLVALLVTPDGRKLIIGKPDKWLTLNFTTNRPEAITARAQTDFTMRGITPEVVYNYTGTYTATLPIIESDVVANYGGVVRVYIADAETVYTYPKKHSTFTADVTFIEPGGWLPISYTKYTPRLSNGQEARPTDIVVPNLSLVIPTDIADVLFNAMKLSLRKLMALLVLPNGEQYLVGSPDKWLVATSTHTRPESIGGRTQVTLNLLATSIFPSVKYTGNIILSEDMDWAVCKKWQEINTGSNDCFLRPVEKLYKLLELRQLTGDKLTPYLYETLQDAGQEGLEGCLAYTISGINRWLERNLWIVGTEKVLVFKSNTNGSGSAYFEYLAEPTLTVDCGPEIVLRKLYSINFNNEVVANSFAISDKFLSMYLITVFDQLSVDNIYYEYSLTDTWGSPLISTNNICEFSAYMANKNTGYIRIRTTQIGFVEGGVLININYEGAESSTSAISVIMPANRIDQDLVLYCENFQLLTATSSQAGDVITFGVRNDIFSAADWTDFSYTTLAAINAVLNTTSLKALALFISEGTANTGANAKTINITGQFTDPKSRGYISLLDREKAYDWRTALENNGGVYDGTLRYDTINSNFNWERTQVRSFLFAFTITSVGTVNRLFDTRQQGLPARGWAVLIVSGKLRFVCESSSSFFVEVQSSQSLKIGNNIGIITYSGNSLASGVQIYINGFKATKTINKDNLGSNTVISTATIATLGARNYAPALVGGYLSGKLKTSQIINRLPTTSEIRQGWLKGSWDGIVSDNDFLLDVDFNQTGTNELVITKGIFVAGFILSVADNGAGKPRFTVNGTTHKSPVNGATVIIIGTIDYDTGTTGAVITRISDTQFDILTQAFVSNREGDYRVRITAVGGAAYTSFY